MTRCRIEFISGECLSCGAAVWNGEACRRPLSVEESQRKNAAYAADRARWRVDHPLKPAYVESSP